MWARQVSATDALTAVRQAREQVWLNPSFHEQLVLFEACRYAPSQNEGIYRKWRMQLEEARRQVAAQRARAGGSGASGSRVA